MSRPIVNGLRFTVLASAPWVESGRYGSRFVQRSRCNEVLQLDKVVEWIDDFGHRA